MKFNFAEQLIQMVLHSLGPPPATRDEPPLHISYIFVTNMENM